MSDRLPALTRELEAAGHVVFTPVDTEGFDYVGASTVERAEQKRSYDLIPQALAEDPALGRDSGG